MTASKTYLILPAAGVGSRMKADRPKQYLQLHGKTILEHTLDTMLDYRMDLGLASGEKADKATEKAFEKIVLVVTKGDPYWQEISALEKYADNPRLMVADGGEERCHSVLNGLKAIQSIADEKDRVAVHDIARPCIRHSDLDLLFAHLNKERSADGAILAAPVRDTMKRGFSAGSGSNNDSKNKGNQIAETVERNQLWHALTPQVFPLAVLIQALEAALVDGFQVTDEASALEHIGKHPSLITGRADNIKVTHPDDLELCELFLMRNLNSKNSN